MNLPPRQERFINCLLERPHSRKELGEFNKDLLEKDEVIILTKHDLIDKNKLSMAIKKLENE